MSKKIKKFNIFIGLALLASLLSTACGDITKTSSVDSQTTSEPKAGKNNGPPGGNNGGGGKNPPIVPPIPPVPPKHTGISGGVKHSTPAPVSASDPLIKKYGTGKKTLPRGPTIVKPNVTPTKLEPKISIASSNDEKVAYLAKIIDSLSPINIDDKTIEKIKAVKNKAAANDQQWREITNQFLQTRNKHPFTFDRRFILARLFSYEIKPQELSAALDNKTPKEVDELFNEYENINFAPYIGNKNYIKALKDLVDGDSNFALKMSTKGPEYNAINKKIISQIGAKEFSKTKSGKQIIKNLFSSHENEDLLNFCIEAGCIISDSTKALETLNAIISSSVKDSNKAQQIALLMNDPITQKETFEYFLTNKADEFVTRAFETYFKAVLNQPTKNSAKDIKLIPPKILTANKAMKASYLKLLSDYLIKARKEAIPTDEKEKLIKITNDLNIRLTSHGFSEDEARNALQMEDKIIEDLKENPSMPIDTVKEKLEAYLTVSDETLYQERINKAADFLIQKNNIWFYSSTIKKLADTFLKILNKIDTPDVAEKITNKIILALTNSPFPNAYEDTLNVLKQLKINPLDTFLYDAKKANIMQIAAYRSEAQEKRLEINHKLARELRKYFSSDEVFKDYLSADNGSKSILKIFSGKEGLFKDEDAAFAYFNQDDSSKQNELIPTLENLFTNKYSLADSGNNLNDIIAHTKDNNNLVKQIKNKIINLLNSMLKNDFNRNVTFHKTIPIIFDALKKNKIDFSDLNFAQIKNLTDLYLIYYTYFKNDEEQRLYYTKKLIIYMYEDKAPKTLINDLILRNFTSILQKHEKNPELIEILNQNKYFVERFDYLTSEKLKFCMKSKEENSCDEIFKILQDKITTDKNDNTKFYMDIFKDTPNLLFLLVDEFFSNRESPKIFGQKLNKFTGIMKNTLKPADLVWNGYLTESIALIDTQKISPENNQKIKTKYLLMDTP